MDALGSPGVRAVAVLVAALAVSACGTSVSSLPTHRLVGEGPTALTEGTLVDRDGCVLIATQTGESLVLWPPGHGRVGSQIVRSGMPVAQIGEVVELGGGEYGDDSFDFLQRDLLENDIPTECRSPRYWLATTIEPQAPE
jgi:hypothetical protein